MTAKGDPEEERSSELQRDMETALSQNRGVLEGPRGPQEPRPNGERPRCKSVSFDTNTRRNSVAKEQASDIGSGCPGCDKGTRSWTFDSSRQGRESRRVARVEAETAEGDVDTRHPLLVLPDQGACQSGRGALASPCLSGTAPEGGTAQGMAALCDQGEEQSELALALRAGQEVLPSSTDQRELVPVQGAAGTDSLQDLLTQLVAENRALRYRLEQMETPTSWHAGIMREGFLCSGVSNRGYQCTVGR